MPADTAMRSAVFTSLTRAGLSRSSRRKIAVTPNPGSRRAGKTQAGRMVDHTAIRAFREAAVDHLPKTQTPLKEVGIGSIVEKIAAVFASVWMFTFVEHLFPLLVQKNVISAICLYRPIHAPQRTSTPQ